MKKVIMIVMITMLTFMSAFADTDKVMLFKNSDSQVNYEWVRNIENTTVYKQNFKRHWMNDPELEITFNFGDSEIDFNIYQKVVIDDKVFLLGNGNNDIYCICITGNDICIPVYNKKLKITSKRLASYLIDETMNITETDEFQGV